MTIRFASDRPRRRPNLTPMIDVVFLLLVFFMLVSRFGVDRVLPLGVAGAGPGWSGPPRLVDVAPGGLALNGVAVAPEALAAALAPLMQGPGDAIVLRARDAADLQSLVRVMDMLRAAGFTRLVLVEQGMSRLMESALHPAHVCKRNPCLGVRGDDPHPAERGTP